MIWWISNHSSVPAAFLLNLYCYSVSSKVLLALFWTDGFLVFLGGKLRSFLLTQQLSAGCLQHSFIQKQRDFVSQSNRRA